MTRTTHNLARCFLNTVAFSQTMKASFLPAAFALFSFALAGFAAEQIASPVKAAEPEQRPNFIFLYADDQRWDALGVVQRELGKHARFPWLQTPHLDRLAAEGVRFRNAFVVHSLCTPSRASFLTGRYTHSHGVVGNFTPFPTDAANHGSLLRKAGYSTAYIGKWHMGDGGGQRPGFEHSASYRGHGRYEDCVFEVDGSEVATKGWVDDAATDFAIDFLRKNRSRPFSLVVGFKSPHADFTPPARLRTKFAGEELGPPPNWNNPAIYLGRVQLVQATTIKRGGNRRVEDPLDYFRVIAGIDENVGRLLAALDELGLTDDTMVIYSSDNGYHFRDHGIDDKRSAYEESMRVPMLVRYPRLREMRGVTHDAMVLNIDLAPTLLDFAGAPPDPAMQGRSWRPLLERRADTIRDQFLYEYFFYRDISDYELQTANCPITPTITALRTATTKLITYPGRSWVELFDLRTDPHEKKNLAHDPRHAALRREMEERLARELKAVDYRVPAGADEVSLEGLEQWKR